MLDRLEVIRRDAKRPRRLARPPQPFSVDGLEARYYRQILAYTMRWQEELKRRLLEAAPSIQREIKRNTPVMLRKDDPMGDLDRVINGTRFALAREYTQHELEMMAARIGADVSDLTRRSIERQWKRVLGIDLATSDAGIARFLPMMASTNAKLIQSIPERALPTLTNGIMQRFQQGVRVEEIAAYIDERFGDVMEGNAATIARTEVNKLHGQLSQYQQTEVGVTRYTWASARDERVRPRHRDLDGQVFTWDPEDEPAIGEDGGPIIPGQEINCRCVSLPVIE